ncbi:Beta-mannanase [uncultured Desulfobacterium sp.]|uniref:Beta-mannanase n=1 Tax=uncultured Desulfobacterium sp. TaxID=201089 RepID=A0A445MX11_9BACT|nr:Beta-mannanase [uncultured Desulfobacterium sp.]
MKMFSPIYISMAFLGAFIVLGAYACSSEPDEQKIAPTVSQPGKMALALPEAQAYTGAYIDFGPTEDDVTLEAIESFDALVGKRQAVIGFSSYWAKQSFPKEALQVVYAYGAVALIYWNPWDGPPAGDMKPDRFSLVNIVEGKWDNYIDMWAQEARQFGAPMLVSWGLEMNGTWFPWSGFFYGGGRPVPGTDPPLFQGPELFKKAYRHVVDRVRAQGADNIAWVFHPNNTSEPDEHWNRMANYWPGAEYVDWLGLSAYGKQYPNTEKWTEFEIVLPKFYKEICALDPDKPFILAEWGVGEFPKSGSKAAFITEALSRMSKEFPRLKAAVFWHERWQNSDLSYSNLRVNSSPQSLAAYRKEISNPFWLDRPVLKGR